MGREESEGGISHQGRERWQQLLEYRELQGFTVDPPEQPTLLLNLSIPNTHENVSSMRAGFFFNLCFYALSLVPRIELDTQ